MHNKIKYLIVNADDFGLNQNVNKGVIQGYKNGILTSASIMSITGEAFYEAAELSRNNPGLDIGIHLALCSDVLGKLKPISPLSKIRAITDDSGAFLSRPKDWFRLFTKQEFVDIAELELRAQIEKALDAGITPAHLNSHYYTTTLFPKLFLLNLRLAKEYHIPAVRISREHISCRDFFYFYRLGLYKSLLLNIICRKYHKLADEFSLISSDYYSGIKAGGILSEDILAKILPKLKEGVTELLVHPASMNSEHFKEKTQLDAICSSKIKKQIERLGIVLTDFKQLHKKIM